MNKPKVELLPIELIKPYWRNPRNIEKAVEGVKTSIQQYGYNQFILVDKEYVIIAGHVRHRALMELGYKEIECIIADLPPDKVKEYRIIDNKTAELSTWNYDELMEEMKTFSDISSLTPFFPKEEIDKFVKDMNLQLNKDIKQDDINDISLKLNNEMVDNNNNDQKEYIELACPKCLEKFIVKRSDVLSKWSE